MRCHFEADPLGDALLNELDGLQGSICLLDEDMSVVPELVFGSLDCVLAAEIDEQRTSDRSGRSDEEAQEADRIEGY
jgi:hypothetical protein